MQHHAVGITAPKRVACDPNRQAAACLAVLLLYNLLDFFSMLFGSFPKARVHLGVCNGTCASTSQSQIDLLICMPPTSGHMILGAGRDLNTCGV